MVFHFAFFRGATNWGWRDIHTLCLKSCLRRTGAEKIVVHFDREDSNPAWEEARGLPKIEWRLVQPGDEVNGHKVTDQRLLVDVYRLRVLLMEGGWFSDLDFVFLKDFRSLRGWPAVIGIQCRQKMKLACGLMGAVPGSTFILAYLRAYNDWNPAESKKAWGFSSSVPWTLSKTQAVHVVDRSAFYPVSWSNKTFWDGAPCPLRHSYAVHLWEPLHPDMSLESLEKTCLGEEIQNIENNVLHKAVVQTRTGTIHWD